MGRAAGGDLEKRQGGLQGFLGAGTVCLGVEHHLGVVPTAGPVCWQLKQSQVFLQNGNIIEAPGEKGHILPTPGSELLHGLRKGDALSLQPGFLNAGELGDPLVQAAVKPGLDQDLKFISHRLVLQDPDSANLNNFPPNLHRERLFCRRRPGPGLIPFHIQYDIIHGGNDSCLSALHQFRYHITFLHRL